MLVRGLLVLSGCQLVGELVVRVLGVDLPGPVAGMLVLLAVLVVRGERERPGSAEATADRLLPHLQLLFIPAGTGVVQYLSVLAGSWLPVVAGLAGAWAVALVGTAGVVALLLRGRRRRSAA